MTSMMIEKAKRMLIECRSFRMPISDIAEKTGMERKKVCMLAQKMRKTGELKKRNRILVADGDAGRIEFNGILHAANEGFDSNSIKMCLSGKYKQHAGYKWKYEEIK